VLHVSSGRWGIVHRCPHWIARRTARWTITQGAKAVPRIGTKTSIRRLWRKPPA